MSCTSSHLSQRFWGSAQVPWGTEISTHRCKIDRGLSKNNLHHLKKNVIPLICTVLKYPENESVSIKWELAILPFFLPSKKRDKRERMAAFVKSYHSKTFHLNRTPLYMIFKVFRSQISYRKVEKSFGLPSPQKFDRPKFGGILWVSEYGGGVVPRLRSCLSLGEGTWERV